MADEQMSRDAAKCAAPWWRSREDELLIVVDDFEKGIFDMATRGMIAKKTESGFIGRYHHWDAYPEALGKTLHTLYNGTFNKNAEAMMHTLIDEHPAGWSSINGANFSYAPGFTTPDYDLPDEDERNARPQCYCHGERREGEQTLTSLSDARRCGAEYAYIIDTDNHTMTVHARSGEAWRTLAVVNLDTPERWWVQLEEDEED